jgi:glutamate N-acetyltransferase/amino-acid N-acetyltransferase
MAALGRAGVDLDPDLIDVYIGDVLVVRSGIANNVNNTCTCGKSKDPLVAARKVLAEQNIEITIDLNAGSSSAAAWTCDLTYDYVKINASYTT